MAKAASQVLAAILGDAAAGRYPASDARVTIISQPSARDAGVIAFTGHSVIFADADPDWIESQLPVDDPFGAPLRPEFLSALGRLTGRIPHHCDMLTCAAALPGAPAIELTPNSDPAHPRISRALRYRDDVRAWEVPGGVVMIGRGIAGRWEVAVEIDEEARGAGLGRTLASAARHVVPDGAALWAQIAPGNAASVRAFLAAGFRPLGAECHLTLP
jgi:GNAT superfamily N-acetyltransferase